MERIKVESERGAVLLIEAVVRNTFQAIKSPKIVGKRSPRSQIKWYKNLIAWAKDDNVLMSFWSDVTGGDDVKIRKLMVKLAKKNLKKVLTASKQKRIIKV